MSSDHDDTPTVTFSPVTRDEWESSAEKALRGNPLASLDTRTRDGIVQAPLYTRERHSMDGDEAGLPGTAPFTRGTTAGGTVGGWEIRQSHRADLPGANAAILRDLERGVTAITLTEAPHDADALDQLLSGVFLDLAPLHLASPSTADQRRSLLEVAERNETPASSLAGCLGADPIGQLARSGGLASTLEAAMDAVAAEAAARAATHPALATVAVDATAFADAGAAEAQEVGAALAAGVAWLRALTAHGLDVDAASRQLEFTVTAGAEQFLTIAKLRALRTGWARIVQSSGGDPQSAPMRLHATTATSMMTQRDPWVNMLRTTTACFAAAVGGADAVTVQPFDSALGEPDETGLRLARNTQLILQQETHTNAVIDPAGGSWYVEDLTQQLAHAAWAFFQDIERAGGIGDALRSGTIQAAIARAREALEADLATRATPITGVSEFPDVHEAAVTRPHHNTPPPQPASAVDTCAPLEAFRWAAPYETLRDAADARDLAIHLANLGPISTHTARASFAKNLFEAGGVTATGTDGSDDASSAAEQFVGSSAAVACICSSDAIYAERGVATASALKAAGAQWVAMAGPPGDREDELRAAGVDAFIHLGCDVLAVLNELHGALTKPS